MKKRNLVAMHDAQCLRLESTIGKLITEYVLLESRFSASQGAIEAWKCKYNGVTEVFDAYARTELAVDKVYEAYCLLVGAADHMRRMQPSLMISSLTKDREAWCGNAYHRVGQIKIALFATEMRAKNQCILCGGKVDQSMIPCHIKHLVGQAHSVCVILQKILCTPVCGELDDHVFDATVGDNRSLANEENRELGEGAQPDAGAGREAVVQK